MYPQYQKKSGKQKEVGTEYRREENSGRAASLRAPGFHASDGNILRASLLHAHSLGVDSPALRFAKLHTKGLVG